MRVEPQEQFGGGCPLGRLVHHRIRDWCTSRPNVKAAAKPFHRHPTLVE